MDSNLLALAVAFKAAIAALNSLFNILAWAESEVLPAGNGIGQFICILTRQVWLKVNYTTVHGPGLFFILIERKPLARLDNSHKAEVLDLLQSGSGHLQLFHLAICLLPSFLLTWCFANYCQIELTRVR